MSDFEADLQVKQEAELVSKYKSVAKNLQKLMSEVKPKLDRFATIEWMTLHQLPRIKPEIQLSAVMSEAKLLINLLAELGLHNLAHSLANKVREANSLLTYVARFKGKQQAVSHRSLINDQTEFVEEFTPRLRSYMKHIKRVAKDGCVDFKGVGFFRSERLNLLAASYLLGIRLPTRAPIPLCHTV